MTTMSSAFARTSLVAALVAGALPAAVSAEPVAPVALVGARLGGIVPLAGH